MKKKLTLSMVRPTVNLPIDNSKMTISEILAQSFDFDVILQSGNKLQRDWVWTIEQEQALIETLVKGNDIGVITVIKCNESKLLEVIDGQHRLKTIRRFCNNEFCLVVGKESYYFSDFDIELTRELLSQYIHFKIVDERVYFSRKIASMSGKELCNTSDEDIVNISKITDLEKVQLFHTVSYTGTPQDRKHIENLYKKL